MGADAARRAWARLAGLPRLDGVQVVVDPESPLGRHGWIGILAVDGTVTACVPRRDLAPRVAAALGALTSQEATMPDVVRPHLPPTRAVLGPASLFYPPAGFAIGEVPGVEEVSGEDLHELFHAVAPDELDESGLAEITGSLVASRAANGDLAAVCGYRRWPNEVAHLSVLAHPGHRGEGHGRRAAAAAIRRAMDEKLLPQWRARPPASQALALDLGLVELGAQLSLEPEAR
jgi:GNAT superfamily N-acetyltransferase